MNFKTLMMAAGAALALVSVEPVTGLLKVSVALVGAAVGAILADPVAEEGEPERAFRADSLGWS